MYCRMAGAMVDGGCGWRMAEAANATFWLNCVPTRNATWVATGALIEFAFRLGTPCG